MSRFTSINIKVAVTCFALATTFWFFITLQKDFNADIPFDIRIKYDTTKWAQNTRFEHKVLLNVEASGMELLRRKFQKEDNLIVLKASELPSRKSISAEQLTKIIREKVSTVHINFIQTDEMELYLEPVATRFLTVSLTSLKIDSLHKLRKNFKFFPAKIKVTGPETTIDSLQHSLWVSPEDIDFTGSKYKFDPSKLLPFQVKASVSEIELKSEIDTFSSANLVLMIPHLTKTKDTSYSVFSVDGVFDAKLNDAQLEKLLTQFIKSKELSKKSAQTEYKYKVDLPKGIEYLKIKSVDEESDE